MLSRRARAGNGAVPHLGEPALPVAPVQRLRVPAALADGDVGILLDQDEVRLAARQRRERVRLEGDVAKVKSQAKAERLHAPLGIELEALDADRFDLSASGRRNRFTSRSMLLLQLCLVLWNP